MVGFGTPAICNEVHLVAEGLHVAGMSFPGVPGVMIGWNDRVAWTTTSGGADLVDVYALELHPDDPGRYRHGGEWRTFEAVEHEISTTVGPFNFAQNVGPELRFDVPGSDAYARAEWRANVHERVIFLGTFSKVLAPSLRCAYLVVPADQARAFGEQAFIDG